MKVVLSISLIVILLCCSIFIPIYKSKTTPILMMSPIQSGTCEYGLFTVTPKGLAFVNSSSFNFDKKKEEVNKK